MIDIVLRGLVEYYVTRVMLCGSFASSLTNGKNQSSNDKTRENFSSDKRSKDAPYVIDSIEYKFHVCLYEI